MYRSITASLAYDPHFTEAMYEELVAEISRLKLLGKTDGTNSYFPEEPGVPSGRIRAISSRIWDTKETADAWVLFLDNLHINNSYPSINSWVFEIGSEEDLATMFK